MNPWHLALALMGGAMACSGSDITTPTSGSVLWHVAGQAGSGRPAIADSLVYFVAATDSHAVHAFDLVTGKLRWTTPTGLTGTGLFSEAGCLLVQSTVACTDGSDMVALAQLDGHLIWRYHPAASPILGIFPGSVDSLGTTIFAPMSDGAIQALDAASGQPRWLTKALDTTAIVYKVANSGGTVFAPFRILGTPTTGGVVALGAADGAPRWIKQFTPAAPDSGTGANDLALWGSLVIASTDDGRIIALDQTTGQVIWTLPGVGNYPSWFPARGPVGVDVRTLAIVGSTLMTGSLSGWIIAYDLNSHTELWRTGANQASPLLLAGADEKAMYFSSSGELLFAFSATHPQLLWQVGPPSVFISAPAIGTDRLFVGGLDGYYAIRK